MRFSASFKPPSDSVRLFAIGLMGTMLAACSGDVSRFSDSGSASGNRPTSDVGYTSSTRPAGQPVAQIESRPLDQPTYASNGTPVYGPSVYGQSGQQQGGYQPNPSYQPTPSYQPQPAYQPQYSNAPRSVPAAPAPQYMPVNDATGSLGRSQSITVTLKKGETVSTLASRYNVSVTAILKENNLASATRVKPGTRLVIPSRVTQSASGLSSASTTHTVAAHETLSSISRRYHVSRTEMASQNRIGETTPLKIGQKLTIPGTAVANNAPSVRRAETPVQQTPQPQKQIAQNGPADSVASVKPVENPEPPAASNGAGPSFRWPVKGRVISNFGGKPNGQQNDGINISVPENTAVKASEDGVVAYSGNELKGYGNLVLVRHAGGWVTAYAHNSELLVHKGETVKRGQVIAKAGQTGGVAAPQVHFEIRKGSTPVDPAQHLSSL